MYTCTYNTYRYFAFETATHQHIWGMRYGTQTTGQWKAFHEVRHDRQTAGPLSEWLAQAYADPVEVDIKLGTYRPRIWRGPWSPVDELASLSEETRTVVATSVLVSRLRDVFRFVEPSPENDSTFGHEIRSVLLLAAMEVESSLAAVLRANGYQERANGWSTSDYVKLKDPMFLDGYQVKLLSYPDYPAFAPFAAWDTDRSTQSLDWWQAYNSTKHDRDTAFSEATLGRAINAVGAAAILLVAQFGGLSGRQGAGSLIASELAVEPVNAFPFDFSDDFFYVPRPDEVWTKKRLF